MQVNYKLKYKTTARYLFCLFLFGTLSFGRAFSVLHFNISWVPVFITEAILLICIPVILFYGKSIPRKLPGVFLAVLLLYFCYGTFYLFLALANKNIYALRDIVLCGYILFFPIVLILFSCPEKFKIILITILAGNIVAIVTGMCLLKGNFSGFLYDFISRAKPTNLGLCYAIVISMAVSFYDYFKSKTSKLLLLFLLSTNLYMIAISCVRTLWLGLVFLLLFLFIILRVKFLKLFIKLVPVFIVTVIFFQCLDAITLPEETKLFEKMSNEVKGAKSFVKRYLFDVRKINYELSQHEKPQFSKISNEKERRCVGNIVWRVGVWKQAIEFGFVRPLTGRGFGIYPEYKIWGYQKPSSYAINSGIIPTHNHLISIFYKMGFVGLSLFLFVNFYVFVFALKMMKKFKSGFAKCFLMGLLGAFVFWHSIAFFFDIIDSPPTSIFLWVIIGLIFASIEVGTKENGYISENQE